MIVIYHQNEKVSLVEFNTKLDLQPSQKFIGRNLAEVALELGTLFPDQILVWCRAELKNSLNLAQIPSLVRNTLEMISYRIQGDSFGYSLDYIDYSTAIKVQKGVRYPTWKMSSTVGAVYGNVLKGLKLKNGVDSEYFFNAISRNLQPHGLLCYQEPRLLKDDAPSIEESTLQGSAIYRFVWDEIAPKWAYFLCLCQLIYEKKLAFGSLTKAIISSKYSNKILKELSQRPQALPVEPEITVDVLIPTLGREKYVEMLLDDLKAQSIVPKRVIIVEQEKEVDAGSQMPFLEQKEWPFEIKHLFSKRWGPCFARNLGLEHIQSEWTFLADDDIRLPENFFTKVIGQLTSLSLEAGTISCLLKGQKELHEEIHQTRIFGAGCSLVKSKALKNTRFDLAYEFGYAEDSDFGAQLRNQGVDVVYLPSPTILHLKAPVGGFREKMEFPWNSPNNNLKPSPTVMLFWHKHFSENQFLGNKLMIFFSFFSKFGRKNPFGFFKKFQKDWDRSLAFARKLESGELRISRTNA
ncbi:GT2 family glycosyltransferase [Algoriphagus zhangzhouensis]|uniref:Glycosyltransferase, GT2 family n=1 Tax=Algoriphagus zhangzhouensis TaxID=1073327 RepID=A0A1M7ZHW3_9BACT|nr:GT2 family glycosyltransferase [Algoriphagus zhangzhouensis]SHO64464.1 Glycosyltransferase, GT2 family [Algoriphagus zhangzhouensis]